MLFLALTMSVGWCCVLVGQTELHIAQRQRNHWELFKGGERTEAEEIKRRNFKIKSQLLKASLLAEFGIWPHHHHSALQSCPFHPHPSRSEHIIQKALLRLFLKVTGSESNPLSCRLQAVRPTENVVLCFQCPWKQEEKAGARSCHRLEELVFKILTLYSMAKTPFLPQTLE